MFRQCIFASVSFQQLAWSFELFVSGIAITVSHVFGVGELSAETVMPCLWTELLLALILIYV